MRSGAHHRTEYRRFRTALGARVVGQGQDRTPEVARPYRATFQRVPANPGQAGSPSEGREPVASASGRQSGGRFVGIRMQGKEPIKRGIDRVGKWCPGVGQPGEVRCVGPREIQQDLAARQPCKFRRLMRLCSPQHLLSHPLEQQVGVLVRYRQASPRCKGNEGSRVVRVSRRQHWFVVSHGRAGGAKSFFIAVDSDAKTWIAVGAACGASTIVRSHEGDV